MNIEEYEEAQDLADRTSNRTIEESLELVLRLNRHVEAARKIKRLEVGTEAAGYAAQELERHVEAGKAITESMTLEEMMAAAFMIKGAFDNPSEAMDEAQATTSAVANIAAHGGEEK